MKKILSLFLLTAVVFACSHGLSEEEIAILREAAAIHEEAYALQKEADGLMALIAEHKNDLQMRLASINAEEGNNNPEAVESLKGLLVEIENLQQELSDWKAELVEVEIPGEEHDHDHDHGHHDHDHDHDHSHGSSVDITPAQMLEVQKEQRDIITTILMRAKQLRAQVESFTATAAEIEE
jgi:hypothetical protein